MFTSTESRLWLAVHLLYPSASQAFDVYQAVVQQSENLINQDNKNAVFAKFVQAFEKIPAVSSNLSFYEFEFDQIDQWKVIYKNSQKIQLIVFVGVLIFEMKLTDIAPLLKLSTDKAQFLFHQIFKKLAQSSSKLKYSEQQQLNFKKQNDLKISYLYTYENLIEYCLGQLSAEENEKVRAGLELYPILQTTKDEYSKIITQIQNLKVQKSGVVAVKEKKLAPPPAVKETARPFYKRKRNWLALSGVSLLALVLVLQMSGVLHYLLNRDHTLVIGELEKKSEVVPEHPPVAVESVPQEAPAETPVEAEVLPAAVDETPVVVAEPPKPVAPAVPKEILPPVAGGLFRGVLVVENVQAINDKLAAKITALGATKAGEVAIGWMKTPQTAYYHYTIDEKNIDQASAAFREFGRLTLKFEKHPRTLPAGQRRFIVEVEQK